MWPSNVPSVCEFPNTRKRFAEVDGRAFFCTPDVCEVEYGQIFEHTKGKYHMADLSEASECA